MPKTKKPITHFEQVPLEIVKKVAAEEIQDAEVDGDDEVVKTSREIVRLHPQVPRQPG